MRGSVHEYDHHIGDYTRDTVGLSMIEDGAYRRLMDQCYASELPLPAEKAEVYRMARATAPTERKAVDYVLRKYFVLLDDGWHQNRIDREIAEFHGKSSQASAAAALRWERERMRKRNAEGHATAHATASPNADANAHADAQRTQLIRNASRAGADARNRLPPSALPSSELQNRGSGVDPPSVAEQPVDNPANPAVEKIEGRKANGKGDGKGQDWDNPAWWQATAKTVGRPRRHGESDDEWRDGVYAEVNAMRAGAGAH